MFMSTPFTDMIHGLGIHRNTFPTHNPFPTFPMPRFKWLFQPQTSPEAMPAEEAPTLSAVLQDPFRWEPCERSPLECRSVDGVLRVVDPASGEDVFPLPGTATQFFTDMHRCDGGLGVGCEGHDKLQSSVCCSHW